MIIFFNHEEFQASKRAGSIFTIISDVPVGSILLVTSSEILLPTGLRFCLPLHVSLTLRHFRVTCQRLPPFPRESSKSLGVQEAPAAGF